MTPLPNRLTPSDACLALVTRQEGCVLTAMKDVDGVYVLGYGNKVFDGKPVVAGQTTTHDDALRNCRRHLEACADVVLAAVPHVTQGQLDALTDLAYNIGAANFLSSTIVRTMRSGGTVTEDMFTRWNKVTVNGAHVVLPALTARRLDEYKLFTS